MVVRVSKLSGRTISALKMAGITKPHEKSIGQLLMIPNLGVKAVTEIAERIYATGRAYRDEPWPEFAPPPEPEKRCSHKVKISEHCSRCAADVQIRREP
jgi:hypothetical protein